MARGPGSGVRSGRRVDGRPAGDRGDTKGARGSLQWRRWVSDSGIESDYPEKNGGDRRKYSRAAHKMSPFSYDRCEK